MNVGTSEEWRPVRGYEGFYEASDIGRIRSLVTGKVRRQRFHAHYYRVGLSKKGVRKTWCVHRLVCEAFHGERQAERPVVRHLNGNGRDNRAVNLAWGTHAENSADMVTHGRSRLSETHCHAGHPFDEANTRWYAGGRHCRACERARSLIKCRRRRAAQRAALPPSACPICRAEFRPTRGAKYCSDECRRLSRTVAYKRETKAA